MPEIRVEIDGVHIPQIVEDSLSIESIVGQVVDTCDFTVFDKFSNITIPTMSDIVITRLDTTVPTLIFAGLAAYITGTPEGFSRYWEVSGQDYTIMLDRSLVIQSYTAGYQYAGLIGDQAILAAAFEKDVVGPHGTRASSEIKARRFVELGLSSLSQQDFRYSTLREVVAQLAQYVGYDFYVDYDRELHYYYRETNPAPYILTDGPASASSINYRGLSWKRDGTRIVNTFALFGDKLLADNQVAILTTNGTTVEFDLSFAQIRTNFPLVPEPGERTIRVEVNANSNRIFSGSTHTGADDSRSFSNSNANYLLDDIEIGDTIINERDDSWGTITSIEPTVIYAILQTGTTNSWNTGDIARIPIWTPIRVSGDIFAEGETFDALHDALGKKLTFHIAPSADLYGLRLRYSYNFVGGQIDTELPSYDRYGRVFARRVIASDVNSAQGIVQKMAYLREQYANALQVATMKVDDDSFPNNNFARFEAGQWVRFVNNILGVDKSMLIHRVTTNILGGELVEYELEIRDWEVDIL